MYFRVEKLVNRITLTCLDKKFDILYDYDQKSGNRVYIQISYHSQCTKTGNFDYWKGRKWYLSDHMTDDEIVKTVYCAFEAAVKHEIMEGFKVDNKILFNPHIDFEELLKISDKEVFRNATSKL